MSEESLGLAKLALENVQLQHFLTVLQTLLLHRLLVSNYPLYTYGSNKSQSISHGSFRA